MTPASPVPITHVITRLDVGGAQETVVRICAGLDKERWKPIIVTGPDSGSGGSLLGAARDAGVEVVVVPHLHGPVRPVSDIQAVAFVASIVQGYRAALVHTHSSKAGVIGRLAAHRAGVPAVHTVHGWSFHGGQHPLASAAYRGIERWMARKTAALIVVTSADMVTGLSCGIGRPDQYVLVRSGIKVNHAAARTDRTALRRDLGWGPDQQVVVSVGRLEPQKDPMMMVESFAAARSRVPTLRLAFVGSGSLRPAVEATADRLGALGAVDFLGLRDDVPAVLAAADLFALSSRWEGLPRAALEAVQSGLPVVATDTGGIREVIVDGETGRLVPIGDRAALSQALVDLATDADQACIMARRASQLLYTFSEERMVADIDDLYTQLLKRGSATLDQVS